MNDDRMCAHTSMDGRRCTNPGTWSNSTHGAGPWYCTEHSKTAANWRNLDKGWQQAKEAVGMSTKYKGYLRKNEKREKDTQPQYKGAATIDGQGYWLAAWVNENEDGSKYLSIVFERQEQQAQSRNREPEAKEEFEDDIPF